MQSLASIIRQGISPDRLERRLRASRLHSMITGLFTNRDSAERAWRAAAALGYEKSDIDVLMSDDTRQQLFPGNVQGDSGLGGKAAIIPAALAGMHRVDFLLVDFHESPLTRG